MSPLMSVGVRRKRGSAGGGTPSGCSSGGGNEGPIKRVAVNCVRRYLMGRGYDVCDCVDVAVPFDIVARKGDEWLLVAVKVIDVKCRDRPIVFTSSEVDLATRIPSNYMICTVYVGGGQCNPICEPFDRFKQGWTLQKMGEYHYLAIPKQNAVA